MESIHDPDSRSWISARLKPAQILDQYKDDLARIKPFKSLHDANTKPQHLKQMIGISDETTFKELEAAMDISNLDTEGEAPPMQFMNRMGGNYGLGVPKFWETPIPEEGRLALKSLYLHKMWLNLLKVDKSIAVKRRKMHYEDNDNWWATQPPVHKTIAPNVTDREKLYCVRVYRPIKHLSEIPTSHRDLSYTQEIWLLGDHKLSLLRDMITCSADNYVVGNQQVDTLRRLAPRAEDVYKSGFFYINDCFYNDTRGSDNIDYSQVIIDWAHQSKRGIGPFKKGVMEETQFDDLELRVGYPYLYTHQGNHEHLIVFTDIRLLGPEDPQNITKYPLVRSLGTQQSRYCMVCQKEIATWVTDLNTRVPENPYFFCTLCYKQFNLKKNGEKETDFNAFKYLDVNSV